MDFYLLLSFIILFLILGFILLLYFFYKPSSSTGLSTGSSSSNIAEIQSNQYRDISYWGPARDVIGGDRNTCGVYTFTGSVDSSGFAVPATPRLENSVLNQCVSDSNIPNALCYGPSNIEKNACIDIDQVSAKQQIRECVGKGTDSLGCRNYNGTTVPVGGGAFVYISCDAPQCTSSLSSVALNYNFNPNINVILNNAKCLYFDGTNIRGARCDLNTQQLWRVSRARLGSSNSLTSDPKGNYASFFNRLFNRCLAPSTNSPIAGTPVGLGQCSSGTSKFPWLLFPQTVLPAYDSFPVSTAPQQIVWSPKPVKLESNTDLIIFLKSNPLSIVFDNSGILRLQPFARNANIQSNYSAQYLDYTLWNTILQNSNLFPF